MKVYLDASSLAQLALRDAGWEQLDEWLIQHGPTIHISHFGFGEFVSAVSTRVRRKLITPSEADLVLLTTKVSTADWITADLLPSDVAEATELVRRYELMLKLPDAVHLAHARRLRCLVVTADRRQAAAAEALGLALFNSLPGDPSA